MLDFLKEPWPWYVAGPIIGLTVPALLLFGNKVFGLSSSLRHLCAACVPAGIPFFKYDWRKENWNLFFVSGVVLGAWLAVSLLADPEPIVIALMVASGAMGSAGHYFLIAAHRLAPAAVLSPFIYTEIVLVIVLGYLVFGDLPNRWTITGAAIVVASGLYILNRERQVRRNSGISPK